MKIITWNCNMAFRKKASVILAYKPDILIVPECECPDRLNFGHESQTPTDILWFGTNQHKGLAIFSYSDYRFKVLDNHNQQLRMIIPVYVTNGLFDFNLFAIWANNPADPDGQYVEQVWKAIHHYDDLILSRQTILIGDFNSNTIWDRQHRKSNHSSLVQRLEEKGIYSSYHLHYKQVQGQEQHSTFYLYRHKDKPYHLDYCFMSADIAERLTSVEVGDYDYWMKYSDHVPLIITLN
ncbi:endonuclease/exonuclease/phosphatase family protein [Mucilaginibacter pocheonensis]|uniref:Exonuclease III n=1 Tax=Mucilaginibacter pocheonensis TaxID=398050 RepID=A0ABU1T6Y7_9SPHI|nr:endonuclease/exonuclease/phosphatase family protein [Mucilaginibacter pocheonensis]MDR6940666.1 exonuclease III [Mucilaginibacter pocheonensis]